MNIARRNRLVVAALALGGGAVAVALILYALQQNINLFYSPSQVASGIVPPAHTVRIGGLVAAGSVRRDARTLDVQFLLSDGAHAVAVDYRGILPDLFREGQGVVAQGRLEPDGRFRADQVLAKHDENYMPPEVADALATAKRMGVVPAPGDERQ